MRILHVITTLDVGGAEMHLFAQVRGQSQRGHEVRVAWLKGQGSLAGELRAAGARDVIELGSRASLVRRLWPHLRWAEVVHSHLLKADAVTALLATAAGRRRGLVASKHNDEQVLKRPLVSLAHGLIGRLPRRTIVLSEHVGRFIADHGRVPERRQARVYYGLDPVPFEAAAADAPRHRARIRGEVGFGVDDVVFVCVARFAPQKAHDVLLRGFAAAREAARTQGRTLRLLLVGGDPFGDGRERAEAWASSLDLGQSVHFAGIRRDVPELLAASDAFVMTSLWEGFGLVFLEAMAAGLPVIATRVSAVPEVVADGETGLLVAPCDPGAVTDAMLALARDPERRRALGAAGRARVHERFALDRMIEETLDVYASLVGAAGVQARRPEVR